MNQAEGSHAAQVFVLDTSAIYSATDYPPEAVLYSTPMVVRELRRVYWTERAEIFVESRLRITEPAAKSVGRIREIALESGDIARLSPTDIEVLSLAYELGAVLLTEDYSMQNIAEAAGISFRSLYLPPIKDFVEWELRCTSCGTAAGKGDGKECRICGGKLVTRRKKSRPLGR